MEPSRFSNALHRPRAGPLQGVLAGLRGLPGARTKKAHVGRNCTVSTADVALGMEPSRFSKCCFLVTPSRARANACRSTCEVSLGPRFEGSDLPNYQLPERLLGSDIGQQLRRRHWIDIACG